MDFPTAEDKLLAKNKRNGSIYVFKLIILICYIISRW